jgi:hypothetical protein
MPMARRRLREPLGMRFIYSMLAQKRKNQQGLN